MLPAPIDANKPTGRKLVPLHVLGYDICHGIARKYAKRQIRAGCSGRFKQSEIRNMMNKVANFRGAVAIARALPGCQENASLPAVIDRRDKRIVPQKMPDDYAKLVFVVAGQGPAQFVWAARGSCGSDFALPSAPAATSAGSTCRRF